MRPGCRAMGVELEGAVVVAEVEQVREPSSEGQDLMAGSVEASVQSRLPLCGEPRFGFGSPGPFPADPLWASRSSVQLEPSWGVSEFSGCDLRG